MAERAEIVLSGRDQTGAAFASAKRGLTEFKTGAVSAGAAATAAFAGITAVLATAAVAFDRLNPKAAIDQADALAKLNQRTGIGVETLSKYQYAAELAGVSNEELTNSIKRLNVNIAAAARGETLQAEAFQAIGVSVVDAAGKVRSADKVFEDIADRFAGYEDGPKKVAIANALAGKSFEGLIPLLNSGSAGIKSAGIELDKFGGVISTDLARKSEVFNDNLTKLSVSANGLKVAIAGGLIDSLVQYSDEAVKAAQNTGLLDFAWQKLKSLFTGELSRDFAFGKALPDDQLKAAQKNVDNLSASVARLQAYLATNPQSSGTLKQLEQLQGKLKTAQADLQTAAVRAARVADIKGSDFSPAPRTKKDAPALRATGAAAAAASEAEALLRKQLEGRLKVIASAQERERDLFQFAEGRLAEQYQAGELSIAQFYDTKNRTQLDALAAQQQGFDAEVAALRDYQAKLTKPAERADADNRINDVLAKQAKAYREAGQAAEVAETQRVRASEDFRRSLRELDAQLTELSGDRFSAELQRNAIALQNAQKQLAQGGGDDARLANLNRLLAAQAQLNQAQRDYADIATRAQQAEEAFVTGALRAGLGLQETEQGIARIRTDALQQLDALIAKTDELAATTKDPEVLAYFANLKLARERAFDAKDPGLLRFNEAAKSAGQAIAGSFEDAIVEGGKLEDVLKGLEKTLLRIATNALITQPFEQAATGAIQGAGRGNSGAALLKLIGSLFGGSGGGGGFGSGAGYGNQDLGQYFHGGGVVGRNGTQRPMPQGIDWAATPKYHRGGVVGEQPAMLMVGEEVLTKTDPRHRDNGGGRAARPIALTVNQQFAPGTNQRTTNQAATQTGLAVQRAMRRGA